MEDGPAIFKRINTGNGSWQTNKYSATAGWSSTNNSLSPGEGAFLFSPVAMTITNYGVPHVPALPISIPAGKIYLLSGKSGSNATYATLVTNPLNDGLTAVYKWNGTYYSGYYADSLAATGWMDDSFTDVPEPSIGPGEAMWIAPNGGVPPPLPSSSCPTNKTVSCMSAWSFDPPYPAAVAGCTNPSATVFSTITNSLCPLTVTRTWFVSDGCSGADICSQTVTVTNPPPVISCPAMITAYSCSNSVPVFFSVTASNICKIPTTNNCAGCPSAFAASYPPSGSSFGLGTNTVFSQAWDICGNSNWCSFQVVVLPDTNCCVMPVVTTQPQNFIAPPTGDAQFSVMASGTPPLTYQWQHAGTNLPGATISTLNINPVQYDNAGAYEVVVSNPCGAMTSHVAQLIVTKDYFSDGALIVSTSPYTTVGSNVTFTFTVGNAGALALPPLTLNGLFSGGGASFIQASPGLTVTPAGSDFNVTASLPLMPQSTQMVFTVTFNANSPSVFTFNGSLDSVPGEVNFANNNANVSSAFGHPPSITSAPSGYSGSLGDTVSLNATADGTGTLGWNWMNDGVEITGATASTLTLNGLHASDAGNYQARVSNPWGEAMTTPVAAQINFGSQPVASLNSRTVTVVGSAGNDDIEVRRNLANDSIEIDNLSNGNGVDYAYYNSDWDKLVIELGNGDSRLVFNDGNDAASMVTALNKQFEIHSGTGSNVVIASSLGIDQVALPALLNALAAAPDFATLGTNLQHKARTNILDPGTDLARTLYTNLVMASQRLRDMTTTNIAVSASNLVGQANQLAGVASNYLSEAAWRFDVAGYSVGNFSNCLMRLIGQLETIENAYTEPSANDYNPADNSLDETMDALVDQMDGAIDEFELGGDAYEAALEASGDNFYTAVGGSLESGGNSLGSTFATDFSNLVESTSEDFDELAEQLQAVQTVIAEAKADSLSVAADELENSADTLATQAALLAATLNTFTATADPATSSLVTGTAAGCEQDLSSNTKVVIKTGGIVIGTPYGDKIEAKWHTFLIYGLGGSDLIIGSKLPNYIHGGSGDDEIHGQGGPDVILGVSGNDCLFGDDGYDLVSGGNGNDNLHGGDDYDLVIGGNGNDKIYGDEEHDALLAGAGDDIMKGGDGIDLMLGGIGNDTMTGGDGYELEDNLPFLCNWHLGNVMIGGDGDDVMHGGDGIDVMIGNAGADKMYSSNHIDIVIGNAGNDEIHGDDGGALFYVPIEGVDVGFRIGNLMFGGPGNDLITGGKDIDLAFGGANDDTIRGSYSYPFWKHPKIACDCGDVDLGFDYDVIFGGGGNDNLDGGYGIDVVFGGAQNDTIKGNGEPNFLLTPEIGLLFGGEGNDIITGGKTDVITLAIGRAGTDTITGGQWGVLNLLFGGTEDDVVNGNGGLLNIAFGGTGHDTVQGGGLAVDLLFGGEGNDIVRGDGLGGFGVLDVLFGGSGDDDISSDQTILEIQFGQDGSDIMNSGFAVFQVMFGNQSCDDMTSDAMFGLMFGNGGDDKMTGGNGIEIMFGNGEPDVMTGGGDFDVMFGNGDDDTMSGGSERDVMLGNSGNDTLHGDDGKDIMLGGEGEDHIFGDNEADLLFGGRDHDWIYCGAGLDIAFGGKETDCITGGDGTDFIFGGWGNDYIYGDNDWDVLFGGRENDTIKSGGGTANIIFGRQDNDVISTEGEGDRAFGNRGDDSFYNTASNTRLRGNRDNDSFQIASGSGVHIYGGNGADIFTGSPAKKKSVTSGSVTVIVTTHSCAEVKGNVWFDLDLDGSKDSNESSQGGVIVFHDLNGDGLRQSGEPYTITTTNNPATCADETGNYCLGRLTNGVLKISQVVSNGFHETYPGTSHTVMLALLGVVEDRDFGYGPGGTNSPVAITSVQFNRQTGLMTFSGTGAVPNRPFHVLSSTNLAAPIHTWQVVATNSFATQGNFTATNAVPMNDPQRFFLLRMAD